MERAYLSGDASYDGIFYLAVKTTGIFCRPSCSARKPKPENVEFFASIRAAVHSGYRACLRCRPMEGDADHPDWVKRVVARIEEAPNDRVRDADLAAMGLEPARVRRYFASRYGLTFQAYCRARRLAAALTGIRQGGRVDDAVFEAGYESHSGFREAFGRVFGTAPGRAGAADAIRLTWLDTPVGPMIAGATDAGIVLLEFSDRGRIEPQIASLQRRVPQPIVPGSHPHLETLTTELEGYFAGRVREFSVPLIAPGTPFEERVWAALRAIPYGETRSYEDIAVALGNRAAVRAVGRANGRNRIAIVIPCHRVVNKSGDLGGYGGGLWRKKRLLHLEREQAFA